MVAPLQVFEIWWLASSSFVDSTMVLFISQLWLQGRLLVEPTLGVWPIYDTHNNFFCNRVVFNMSQTIHVCIYSLLWAYGELLMQLQLYQNADESVAQKWTTRQWSVNKEMKLLYQQNSNRYIHSQMPVLHTLLLFYVCKQGLYPCMALPPGEGHIIVSGG